MQMQDIKGLFEPKQILHVGKMRDVFFSTGSMQGITGVRKEILYGWKVSYENGYRFPNFKKPVVTDLHLRTMRSAELMEVAVPYMEKLYGFLQQDSFWVTLLDENGVILKLIGSETILTELTATGLIEGSNRGKDAPYGGLFHLVYVLQKPFMLVATEHAASVDDNLAGAACPIFDTQTKKAVGFIAVSGHWWDSHVHTLGLAIIAAEAISQQLQLKLAGRQIGNMNRSMQKINHRLHTTIESIDSGIIYCNEEGRIKTINKNALRYLGISQGTADVTGTNVLLYLDKKITMKKIVENTKQGEVYSYELRTPVKAEYLTRGKYPLYCYIRCISDEDKAGEYIITLSKQSETHLKAANIAYPRPAFTFDDIIGQSAPMLEAKKIAALGAGHNPAILITGESGTGKELFAQAIHNASDRAGGPFIAINCGAIPRTLIESELFGYERGSFTGADKNGHPGKFELAHGGTIFLDEIGDMPYDVQVTLLRVLQTREVLRIGGAKPIKIDVRVISATNKDLQESIRNHTFRDDLYYRLNVFTIALPPLRDRGDDIEVLAQYFLDVYNRMYQKNVAGLADDVLQLFRSYFWPGNIRELENVIERTLIVCQSGKIMRQDLPAFLLQEAVPDHGTDLSEFIQVSASERERILEALKMYEGNITKAARHLGVSRPTLYKRVETYHIRKAEFYSE